MNSTNTVQNIEQFGIYTSIDFSQEKAELSLNFKVPVNHLKHWQQCSIVANFFAKYQSESSKENKERIISIVSTLTNELLENAIKFTDPAHKSIEISLKQYSKFIIIETLNIANNTHTKNLKNTLNKIQTEEIESLFIKKITENHENNKDNSQIGLISIIKDYTQHIGAKIAPYSESTHKIELCIGIETENFLFDE